MKSAPNFTRNRSLTGYWKLPTMMQETTHKTSYTKVLGITAITITFICISLIIMKRNEVYNQFPSLFFSIQKLSTKISNKPYTLFTEDKILHFGKIDKTTAKKFKNYLTSSGNNKKTLFISSQGGDMESALDISDLILSNEIDVNIQDYCLSACANYILPAAHRATIGKDSILGWHGSLQARQIRINGNFTNSHEFAQKNSSFARLQARESAFYKKVNVSEKLPICGLDQIDEKSNPNILVYYYKSNDLKSFGLRNIYFEDEAAWQNAQSNVRWAAIAKFC